MRTAIVLALLAMFTPFTVAAAGPFTEQDFYFDNLTRPHKDTIIRGVNRIAAEDPRCETMDPSSAYISISKGTSENPVFFVMCGDNISNTVNVFFSASDVRQGVVAAPPVHIDQSVAVTLCAAYAKEAAMRPETVDFSVLLNLAVTEHPNGRTTVLSRFSAESSLGVESQYKIRCLLDSTGLLEAIINDT